MNGVVVFHRTHGTHKPPVAFLMLRNITIIYGLFCAHTHAKTSPSCVVWCARSFLCSCTTEHVRVYCKIVKRVKKKMNEILFTSPRYKHTVESVILSLSCTCFIKNRFCCRPIFVCGLMKDEERTNPPLSKRSCLAQPAVTTEATNAIAIE